jgi:hypothetical protein
VLDYLAKKSSERASEQMRRDVKRLGGRTLGIGWGTGKIDCNVVHPDQVNKVDKRELSELDKLDKVEYSRLAKPKGLEGEIWVEEVEGD